MHIYVYFIYIYILSAQLNFTNNSNKLALAMRGVSLLVLVYLAVLDRTRCADPAHELTATACLLRKNDTLKSQFQRSVKLQYNVTNSNSKCKYI